MSATLTGEQAAALVNLSERHLRRLCKAGSGPPQAPDGGFPVLAFGEWLRERIKSEFGITEGGERYDFAAERGRLTRAQADRAELEARELASELVRADHVAEAWGKHIAAARARLLALPSKLAQRVAPPGAIAQAQAIAQDAIHEALNELAGDGVARRRPKPTRDGAHDLAPTAEVDGKRVGRSKPAPVQRVKRGAGKVGHQHR